jgi:hypothetical protein
MRKPKFLPMSAICSLLKIYTQFLWHSLEVLTAVFIWTVQVTVLVQNSS